MNNIVKINTDEFFPCQEHGGKHVIRRVVGEMNGKFVSVTQERGKKYEAVAVDKRGASHEYSSSDREDLAAWLYRVTKD